MKLFNRREIQQILNTEEHPEKYIVTNVGSLNDTGGEVCVDSQGVQQECSNVVGQDPLYGSDFFSRDANSNFLRINGQDNTLSHFDFSVISSTGDAVTPSLKESSQEKVDYYMDALSTDSSCVLDNTTGFMWETKTDDGGLRDKDNYYTWYDSTLMDAPYSGAVCGGGIDCNTEAYITAINNLNLCGASNWRLPTVVELLSIIDFGKFYPALDERYFPNMENTTHYWTSNITPFPIIHNSTDAFTISIASAYVDRQNFFTAYSSTEYGQIHILLVSDGH
ncbi:Lcl C-terminal domain-containing protein [Candidatus Electrothrix sp.]|uniref:Lcl C-terminal domain-containing protein n=2 Tax=Candidatus Electrothrix sp. TaxID=2170559 RepID=UPI004056DAAE